MKTGYSQLLDQAMQAQTQEQADAILQKLVTACIIAKPMSEEAALAIQRENLGYYAGYYSHETRARVERLYKCAHPIFGPIATKGPPTPEEAYAAGFKLGQALKRKANR